MAVGQLLLEEVEGLSAPDSMASPVAVAGNSTRSIAADSNRAVIRMDQGLLLLLLLDPSSGLRLLHRRTSRKVKMTKLD
jgi:hypothetical protein